MSTGMQSGHLSEKPEGWIGKQRPYNFLKHKRVSFIGAPLSAGQRQGGVELAPKLIRDGGAEAVSRRLGWDFKDVGDVDVDAAMAGFIGESQTSQVNNCEKIALGNKAIHDAVKQEAALGNFVLTVGGDHGIASATMSAMREVHEDLAVIWVDAHADCNTPTTSPSGNYHGMPLAHVLNWFPGLPGWEWMGKEHMFRESRVALVGLRDVDEHERNALRQSGVHYWTMHDVDRMGIGSVMDMAVRAVNPYSDRPMHVSLDIDSIDPALAPGTGTCSRGGLTYREVHYICESMALSNNLVSMDLVEVNPNLDVAVGHSMHGDDKLVTADLMTVRLAVELIGSALGKTIA